MKRLMMALSGFGIMFGLLTSPVVAFQCPTLIKQANEAMAKMNPDGAKVKQAKDLVIEAQRLHNAGQHADSVKKANDALALLGVKGEPKPPARRGYSY